MNISSSARFASVVALGSTACLGALIATVALPRPPLRIDPWIAEHLTDGEIVQVQRLANQIVRLHPGADDATRELVQRWARALSIRESAALGILLNRKGQIDPVPWIRLAASREKSALGNLQKLSRRFESNERDYPGIQVTVRGPEWLQRACGAELLSEVTGVGFWQFHDSSIPAETDFSDADVDVLLELPGLERLWAVNSRLSDAGVARLAAMPRMREFHLSGCTHLTDATLRAVARPELRFLDVSRAVLVSDGGVIHLSGCPSMEELRLSETGITSASLATISRMHSLRTLALDKTLIREGLDQLESLDQLSTLGLSSLGSSKAPVPSESLKFLSQLKRLQKLDLSETAIRRLEVRNLPELEHLSLGHVSLKEISFRNLPRIRQMQTGHPSTRQDIHLELIELEDLGQITQLTLHCQSPAAANGLAAGLAALPSLTELYLPVATMTDLLAESLGQHPALERLLLENSGLSDGQLGAILHAPRLKGLDCGGQILTDAGFAAIASADHLINLKLRGLRHADPYCLFGTPSLKTLVLWDPDIEILTLPGDTAIRYFEAVRGRIGRLQLQECPALERIALRSAVVEHLSIESCPVLTGMFAGGTRLETVVLHNLPKLEDLTIQERAVIRELRLTKIPALRSCTFWASEMALQPLQELVGIPNLAKLDISSTTLEDEGAQIISRMAGLRQLAASSRFSRAGLEHLQQLHRLQRLSLYRRDDANWTKSEARAMFADIPDFVVFDSGKY